LIDVLDWLQTVVDDCVLLSEPREAIALVPDIGLDAPRLLPLKIENRGVWKGFPVAFADELRGPLAKLVAQQFSDWSQGIAPQPALARPDALAEDPLVTTVTELLVESWEHSPRLATGVILEVARQSAALFSGQVDEFSGFPNLAGISRGAAELARRDEAERAATIQGLVWNLAGRLSASWTLAARLNPEIGPGRLYQAMLANRLVFTHPARSLDSAEHLGLVAALHGVDIDSARLTAAYLVISAVLDRALAGEDAPVAQALRDLAGDRKGIAALALDPAIAPLALHSAASVLDAKAVKDLGLSKADQKALLKGEGTAAIAAAYTRCARELLSWDLLSAAVRRSVPLTLRGIQADTRLGRLETNAAWPLLVPRGRQGVTDATVVALDLSELQSYIVGRAPEVPGIALSLPGLRDRLFRAAREMEGVAGGYGSFALCAFTHPGSAEGFLRRVRELLKNAHLDRGVYGPPVPLPGEVEVRSAVATGRVGGGWDGEQLRLWGPAVRQACRAAARGEHDDDHHHHIDGGDFNSVGNLFAARPPGVAPAPAPAPADPFTSIEEVPPPISEEELQSMEGDPFATMEIGDPFTAEALGGETYEVEADEVGAPTAEGFDSYNDYDDEYENGESLDGAPMAQISFGAGPLDEPTEEPPPEPEEERNPFDDESRTVLTSVSALHRAEAPAVAAAPPPVALTPLEEEPLEPLDDEPVAEAPEPESVEAELFMEIVEDEESEYEFDMDDDGDDDDDDDDPNTELDGYFLPGEIASPGELAAVADESEDEPGDAVLVDDFEDEPGDAALLDDFEDEPGDAVLLDDFDDNPGGEAPPDGTGDEAGDAVLVDDFEDPFSAGPLGEGFSSPAAALDEGERVEQLLVFEDEAEPFSEPSKDEVTFNVPLSRDEVEDEPVGDRPTFDFALGDLDLGDAPEESGEVSSGGILQLDDEPYDLPGEPSGGDEASADEEFVIGDPPTGAGGQALFRANNELAWLEKAEEPEEQVEESSEDSFSGAALPDLEYLFQGYVVFTEGEGVVYFGRRYGKRLLDVHSYDCGGSMPPAYRSFLNDKVVEGFVPRADLTRSLPQGVDVVDVDLEEMGRAFRALAR
jgi:hypothetical protein